MKKKILLIFLTLVMVMTFSGPATALAAKPSDFNSSGIILGILPSDEFDAGNSGRVVVQERQLMGYLAGPDISGPFIMTYQANVELYTQEGNFHGTLLVLDDAYNPTYNLKVNGKSGSDQPVPVFDPIPIFPEGYHLEMTLTINGNYTFADGAKGEGKFEGSVIAKLTPQGHIYAFGDSAISLAGKWQP
ncbi:hypothetical protein ACFLUG_03370 [Chloroflexota bacterium]